MVFLSRKGKKFQDTGEALVFDPNKQTFNGTYLLQKEGKPLRVRQATKQRLEYLKGENPVGFKALAELVTIEIVTYLTALNGGEPVELTQVYQEGAYLVGVSTETVKRYVFAHTAMSAELLRVGKRVKPNPFYEEDEDEE